MSLHHRTTKQTTKRKKKEVKMEKQKYRIDGIIRLWNVHDVIEINGKIIRAHSTKQAKLILAKEISKSRGINAHLLYQRILKSNLKVTKI